MLQRQKKFTEPVALSSASPGNFRPSALRLRPTALRSDFDLLALRARCKSKPMRWDMPRQEGRDVEKGALCEWGLGKSCGFPASSAGQASAESNRAKSAGRSSSAPGSCSASIRAAMRRRHHDHVARLAAAGVPERVHDTARHEHGRAGRRLEPLVAADEAERALEHVPGLVVAAMQVQRRDRPFRRALTGIGPFGEHEVRAVDLTVPEGRDDHRSQSSRPGGRFSASFP